MSLLKLFKEQTAGDDDTVPATQSETPDGCSSPRGPALYVATNLESWETHEPHHHARDVGIAGTCFRQLDPDYYAWLRHKMNLVRKAAGSGSLQAQAFDALRTKFNVVHVWAMEHLGEEALRAAVRSLDPKTYALQRIDPVDGQPTAASPAHEKALRSAPPYLFPEDGDWQFTQPVRASAVPKIDAIRD